MFDSLTATLGEKLIHRTLKFFVDLEPSHHEIPVLNYFADVKNTGGIFEIQTRSFERLLPKLEALLPDNKITVIYPLISEKNSCMDRL